MTSILPAVITPVGLTWTGLEQSTCSKDPRLACGVPYGQDTWSGRGVKLIILMVAVSSDMIVSEVTVVSGFAACRANLRSLLPFGTSLCDTRHLYTRKLATLPSSSRGKRRSGYSL